MSERKKLAELRARIKELEALLLCVECGHLRADHEDGDAPCFGGRSPDMPPGEGTYCNCPGFVSEHMRTSPADTVSPTPSAEQAIAHDVRHAESVGAAYVQVRTQNLRAVLSSLAEARRERDELRERHERSEWLAMALAAGFVGVQVKLDAPNFPGANASREEIEDWIVATCETLQRRIAAGTPND